MWSPPFSRPTRRRRRIHVNLADFYAPVELILASITWPRFLRTPRADPPARAIATMAAARARRLKADLTSSQPTKDDHRGNQTEQNGNRDATELACGCGVFPRRAAARDAPAVWCFLPPGRVEEWPSPRLGRSPHGSDEQIFGGKQQIPGPAQSD